jgi:hypothetical protein
MFVPPGLFDWVPGRPKTRFRSDAVSHIFSDVETSKLTTSPVLLFQRLYWLRSSKLTTTPVLLFRCLSGKERPSSLPHHTPCCCFNAIMAANVQAHKNHTSVAVSKPLPAANVQAHNHTSVAVFDAFQAKNVQAHYHTTHRVAVSMPLWRRTSKLTKTTPVLLFQSLYRLRTSKLTTHTTVLLFRYLSGKERPSSLQQNTQCYILNAVWRRTPNAHYFHLQHKYIL